jgi:hypothetical protein
MKKRILNFENFLLESNKFLTINEQTDLSAISSSELQSIIDMDMKSYLKKAMWNKSIEVFYGKDYKGNPTEDAREVYTGAWLSGHDKHTMGEFFLDAWAETDQFCDRVVEYVETGKISDTWGDIGTGALWTLAGAAITVSIVASGGAMAGVYAGLGVGGGVVGTGAGLALISWGVPAGIIGGVAGLSAIVSSEITANKYKNLSPALINVANLINDKEATIKNFKSAIEGHWSDFEADWGLDRWLPAIQGMPGWNNSSWAKAGADNIGYSFTYWIANYAYQFLKIKFGATIAKTIKDTPPLQAVTTVKAKVEKSNTTAPTTTQTTAQPDSTTTTPVGGVMGATQPKQYNIVVDDSTVVNYDL